MHCLSEVSSCIPTRTVVEQRLSKWLLFECEFRGTALLAREEEFPLSALENALWEGSERIKTTILQSLNNRTTIPPSIIKLSASWLDHPNMDLYFAAIDVLRGRSNFPEEILQAVAARLGDERQDVRRRAVEVVGGRSRWRHDYGTSMNTSAAAPFKSYMADQAYPKRSSRLW